MTRRISWPSAAIMRVTPHVAQNDQRTRRERHRCAHHAARGLCHQSTEEEAHRRMFRMAEDDRVAAESASSRDFQSGLDVHLRLCRLQLGAYAEPEPSGGSTRLSCGKRSSPWTLNRLYRHSTKSPAQRRNTRERQEIRRVHQFFSSLLGYKDANSFHRAFPSLGRDLTRTMAIAPKELRPGEAGATGRSVKSGKRNPLGTNWYLCVGISVQTASCQVSTDSSSPNGLR